MKLLKNQQMILVANQKQFFYNLDFSLWNKCDILI